MQCETLWLARHGVRWEPVPPSYLPYDCPVSALGQQQADALAARLADTAIDHIFCSPFLRTLQTVAPVARRLQLPIKLEWSLAEYLNPQWLSGFPHLPTLEERHQQFSEVDLEYQSQVMPVYPESLGQHWQRVARAVDFLVQNYGPVLFLMSHGAPTIGVRRHLLQRDEAYNIDFCCLSQLVRHGDGWHYALASDPAHLSALGIHVCEPV